MIRPDYIGINGLFSRYVHEGLRVIEKLYASGNRPSTDRLHDLARRIATIDELHITTSRDPTTNSITITPFEVKRALLDDIYAKSSQYQFTNPPLSIAYDRLGRHFFEHVLLRAYSHPPRALAPC